MGKINKHSNLYDKGGTLIRKADPVLKAYSIKELEEYLDTLEKGSLEYNNAMSWLIGMYNDPRTPEDKEYVEELQNNLIKKLKDEQDKKKQREAAGKTSLEQLAHDLEQESKYGPIEDAEVVEEPVSGISDGGDKKGAEQ